MQTEQMLYVYHGRTKGWWPRKIDLSTPNKMFYWSVQGGASAVASGPRAKLASCKSALTPQTPTPTPGGLFYWPF